MYSKQGFSGFSKTKTELQIVPDNPDIKLDDVTTTNGSERVNDDTLWLCRLLMCQIAYRIYLYSSYTLRINIWQKTEFNRRSWCLKATQQVRIFLVVKCIKSKSVATKYQIINLDGVLECSRGFGIDKYQSMKTTYISLRRPAWLST